VPFLYAFFGRNARAADLQAACLSAVAGFGVRRRRTAACAVDQAASIGFSLFLTSRVTRPVKARRSDVTTANTGGRVARAPVLALCGHTGSLPVRARSSGKGALERKHDVATFRVALQRALLVRQDLVAIR
jgi:hypothetical protein